MVQGDLRNARTSCSRTTCGRIFCTTSGSPFLRALRRPFTFHVINRMLGGLCGRTDVDCQSGPRKIPLNWANIRVVADTVLTPTEPERIWMGWGLMDDLQQDPPLGRRRPRLLQDNRHGTLE